MTRRVLVVDDDEDLRFLLRVVLDREGETSVVAEAANGREAIDAAREHSPDVIILDEMMPVMSGMEALPELREAAPRGADPHLLRRRGDERRRPVRGGRRLPRQGRLAPGTRGPHRRLSSAGHSVTGSGCDP